MARELNGAELAGFIKERQAYQVRNLRQEHRIVPKLLILMSARAGEVIKKYVGLKQQYGQDILVDVEVHTCAMEEMEKAIQKANGDDAVHAVIVQLPLDDPARTDQIVDSIDPLKDVDGLGKDAQYTSATAEAIDWLLSGYNIDLKSKKIAVLGGRGRLVGAPLVKLWSAQGYTIASLDIDSKDTDKVLKKSEVIVTATGAPRLLTSERVPKNAVIVDAGTASENGTIVGDVDDMVRTRRDVGITPKIGGVGPMTVAVLFDHVIQAALRRSGNL